MGDLGMKGKETKQKKKRVREREREPQSYVQLAPPAQILESDTRK